MTKQDQALRALDQAVKRFVATAEALAEADAALTQAMADCRAVNVVTAASAPTPPRRRRRRATKAKAAPGLDPAEVAA